MFRLLVLVVLLAVISANPLEKNVDNELTGRIIGGENTTIEEVPYQISLQVDGDHACGGSIISENWVITGAVCNGLPLNRYKIRAGSTLQSEGGSLHSIAEIISHKGFGLDSLGRPVNDIALVRVKEPFFFDETRQPISLYNAHEESAAGVLATITGWGNTVDGFPDVLQIVHIPIVSKKSCDEKYSDSNGLPNGEICAGYPEGGKSPCVADAGSPLAINGRLAGIVSWGRNCGLPGYLGVYTEIASYREWIKQHSGI